MKVKLLVIVAITLAVVILVCFIGTVILLMGDTLRHMSQDGTAFGEAFSKAWLEYTTRYFGSDEEVRART